MNKKLFPMILAGLLLLGEGGPAVAADREADVRQAGVLKVCIWPDYYGITFRNPKSGQLTGLDISLSQAFAADLGVKVEYVDVTFPTFIDALLERRCDVAMFGIGALPSRAEKVRFSLPYLRSDLVAVTLRNHPSVKRWADIDQPGRVVSVLKGTFMEPVMRAQLKHAELQVVAPPETREREVRSGRADVFMSDYPYTRRVLDNEDWAHLVFPDQPVFPLDYAYAVAPGDDAWLARVNRFVSQIKQDGRLAAAAEAVKLTPIVVKD
ncbi:Cyclohexadienyl dehydratase [bioreactor metagenome]|uniref:Amino acid ABC transporter substrate-binding protein n=2 Tax=root TaxID=1 RepID=A0A323V7R7_9RHOO|nr:ABC transporter substrate-binding protein [Parazoarcus communis]NMG50092.1 transporter substrate-binding domain-containing protein [Parazoarcus communis]NMG70902.1 transporter substrate-binding domain-containing protein [Parazoarcus communis SWub3 = DSM 12120]PZA16208.1 amino acid ABC transporter substrate-binding protein [Azoarcus communis] [Parazoarcus communis SWub3 = DSM 12120]